MRLHKLDSLLMACLFLLLFITPIMGQSIQDVSTTLRDAAGDRLLVGTAIMSHDLQDPRHAHLIAKQFTCITPGNEMKPDALQRVKGRFTFNRADTIIDFARAHDMQVIGHTLVWHNQSPRWLFEDEQGQPLPREVALANMKAHITTVVQHFKGKVKGWDVVNEAIPDGPGELRDTPAHRAIGDDYILKAFEYAHEADPDTELYYNDYNIAQDYKRDRTLRLLRRIRDAGLRIDGVGVQGHYMLNHPSIEEIERGIKAYIDEGFNVMITELDVDPLPRAGRGGADLNASERNGIDPYKDGFPPEMQQKLADRYRELFEVFLRYPQIKRVTFWGTTDQHSWLNHYPIRGRTNHPLLWDRQFNRKPAFDAVLNVLQPSQATAATRQQPSHALPATLAWTSSDVLVPPPSDAEHEILAIKDPSIVRYNDRWHIYATTASKQGQWQMVYLSFPDWEDAKDAKPYYLDQNPNLRGYHCAPQVFYFTPHKKWYLIYQSQHPQYSTADDLAKPETWTAPQNFFDEKPATVGNLWIDYWVICDDTHAYLFFTGDDGKFYRSRTTIDQFPNGMSEPVVVLEEKNRFDLFEGSATYKLKGTDQYLTIIEALGPDGVRFYKGFTADRLDGEWKPYAVTWDIPFAGMNNVTFAPGVEHWTNDISHGELIREGYDQTMTVDPYNFRLLYQGRKPSNEQLPYHQLPYRLGLLEARSFNQKPK